MPQLDMPLGDLIRRASTYILGLEEEGVKFQLYEDNDTLFCKNNVCVHPPASIRKETDIIHNPGYLTITSKVFVDQYTQTKRPTLFLTWIPNSKFVKFPSTMNSNSVLNKSSVERNSIESLTSSDSIGSYSEQLVSTEFKSTNPFLKFDRTDSLCESLSSDDGEKQGTVISINVDIANPAIEISTPDSIKDATKPFHVFDFSRSESMTSDKNEISWCATSECLSQNLCTTFLNKSYSSPTLTKKTSHNCRRFSVDLSQMRSLRLFFNDDSCTCGQLVVASRESQYKILHFHHGGLDHLAQILHQWHSLLHSIQFAKGVDDNLPYRHFMVCRPEVSDLELHPEEGHVSTLTEEMFHNLFSDIGQLEDDLLLRKYVFFAGLNRCLRKQVWPFLLHVFPYQTTYDERNQIMEIRRQEYIEISKRRLELDGTRLKHFKRNVKSIIEKDVVRTDRSNPFFAGDGNPNLEIMKNILLNYSLYNSGLGYTQGMSDLLAPVLCELKDEVLSFWCFVGLMQRAVFVATPTDRDMDVSLRYLRNLIRIMVPNFYQHLEKHKDAMELLFCHRWILLCFKREFTEAVALRMWEACWANYLTDYFHLFLCLAIICVYADDVITQDLKADEMLLYFSSLAMYMDGVLILRKARGLLHQFRQLREIPCSLAGLCSRCGPGIWDSTHSPLIYCSGHEKEMSCNICIN